MSSSMPPFVPVIFRKTLHFRSIYLFITYLFLFISCAQIQSLEGGPVDEQAPKPVHIQPPNESTYFDANQLTIEFDEFIKLTNPQQNIRIIPNDATIRASLNKKKLSLQWDEQLRENTTYSIFLNRAISDITEGNDTIIQVVFSTGGFIDSLTYSTFVVDAYTKEVQKNIVLGLFNHPDSLQPIYFTQTDQHGRATLKFLKKDSFYVRAFSDDLKQGKINQSDKIAFKTEPIFLESNKIDSLPLQLFSKNEKAKIVSCEYKAPGIFILKTNRTLRDANNPVFISINKQAIDEDQIVYFDDDSIALLFRPDTNKTLQFDLQSSLWTDSMRLRLPPKTSTKICQLSTQKTHFLSTEELIITATDQIESVDTSYITVLQLPDSTQITNYTVTKQKNKLIFTVPFQEDQRIKITINPGAILLSQDWKTALFEQVFTPLNPQSLGTLNVHVEQATPSAFLLEVIQNKKTIQKVSSLDAINNTFTFTYLEPGEYSFRIIKDINRNNRWDSGDFEQRIQPEPVYLFSKTAIVRANWDVSVDLVLDED